MKKYFIAAILLMVVSSSYACSICGCGGGNLYMGLFPNFKSKFFGIRHNYSEYHTSLLNSPDQFSHNFYNTVEVWSGFNIGKRWQVLAFLPYHYNIQNDDDMGRTKKTGLGDITLLANYKLFSTPLSSHVPGNISHELWIGGGFKLPTGAFKVNVNDSTTTLADINSQIGTGSLDLFLNARHTVEVNNFGINTSLNYKIALANNQGYKYGNKITVNSIAYYKFNSKSTTIMPNVGLSYENIEGNSLNGNKIILSDGLNTGSYHTGGYELALIGGLEFNFNKISIGGNIQSPLAQEFAKGQTTLNIKGMIHVTLAL
ncbi:MAG: hypothetical protein WCH78_06605 [Bacteroidota bacterium]